MAKLDDALRYLNAADLSYQEWLNVGMALHAEGRSWLDWDLWSRNDSRYREGECRKKWDTFHGSPTPITGGTIVRMARERGWVPGAPLAQPLLKPSPCLQGEGGRLRPDEVYSAPQRPAEGSLPSLTPVQEFRVYLETLFRPEERVCIVSNDVFRNTEGKWNPGRGTSDRTAGQLLSELEKHPNDLGAVIGDWKPDCGAWIRFNPVDGKGIKNENVTRFTYALVESDSLPLEEQKAILTKLELPVACMVYSGGKSLHAIVHVDAENAKEYRERVEILYAILEREGFPVDVQNRNPSRLSRLPGATRNGKRQALLGVNLGKASWESWTQFFKASPVGKLSAQPTDEVSRKNVQQAVNLNVRCGAKTSSAPVCALEHLPQRGRLETTPHIDEVRNFDPEFPAEEDIDVLPPLESLEDYITNVPVLPEELIKGILRRGHKMLISGSSKAGKSFLLMELCIAIAEGIPWLGFPCRKGRVLYVNLEIDKPSCIHRFLKIYDAMNLPATHAGDIQIWNLRGKALPLDQLVPKLLRRTRDQQFDAVIIDPIYKILMGDENSASDMGKFCNEFDRICAGAGCAVIYCHHHSKGAQGSKRAMDRASGSGVFARDPDAQLDLIQLELSEDIRNNVADGNATAWRLESSLREFRNIQPLNCWFEYPVHRVDSNRQLAGLSAQGSPEANLSRSSKRTSCSERESMLNTAFGICAVHGVSTVKDLAEYLGIAEKSVRRYLDEFSQQYGTENGVVYRR